MSRKILRLHLQGYQQFADLTLDFTHPETGEPLDRVCLIGANGTGKSTVLRVLNAAATAGTCSGAPASSKVVLTDVAGMIIVRGKARGPREWAFLWPEGSAWEPSRVAACLAEDSENRGLHLDGPPSTHLNNAVARSGARRDAGGRWHQTISTRTIESMWTDLIATIYERRQAREEFETRPENLSRTKADLLQAFDAEWPDPLNGLAALWNRLLRPAGLVFDPASARVPTKLEDNLEAEVVTDGGERVPFGQLSTGIRNFLFRVGHLFLMFERGPHDGIVLVDEPENSLFPDFLFTLMETYDAILSPHPVQLFVATHNPIVAAQFEPHERIVLEWEDGHVTSRRGTAPKGDDPNDVLLKDFGLPHVMGPRGLEQWRRFQDLRRAIRQSTDESDKLALMEEAARIGREYGFGP